jgi:hypothetical protein
VRGGRLSAAEVERIGGGGGIRGGGGEVGVPSSPHTHIKLKLSGLIPVSPCVVPPSSAWNNNSPSSACQPVPDRNYCGRTAGRDPSLESSFRPSDHFLSPSSPPPPSHSSSLRRDSMSDSSDNEGVAPPTGNGAGSDASSSPAPLPTTEAASQNSDLPDNDDALDDDDDLFGDGGDEDEAPKPTYDEFAIRNELVDANAPAGSNDVCLIRSSIRGMTPDALIE